MGTSNKITLQIKKKIISRKKGVVTTLFEISTIKQ